MRAITGKRITRKNRPGKEIQITGVRLVLVEGVTNGGSGARGVGKLPGGPAYC